MLLTNIALEHRGGSELYLLDVARWLRQQGHAPVAYSARLGPFADTVRRHAIPVVDDLERLGEPPDVIHAHHHLPALVAINRFPRASAVYFCHGWLPWDEAPLRHPAIRRYVAVSTVTRERLVAEHGVDPGRVHVLPNFVDTDRFQPRDPLPERPRRALIFSNQARESDWVRAVRMACDARHLAVDVAGWGSGNPAEHPERLLTPYDVVFARGRSALEAMAVGCAVVLCDEEGLGPMVTPDTLDALGLGNFGVQVLTRPHTVALLLHAIDAYEPAMAAEVSRLVRSTRSMAITMPRVFGLYEEAMAESMRQPHPAAAADAAVADYLAWLHREFPVPWLAQRERYARTILDVERRARELAADVERLHAERAGETVAAGVARDEAARLCDELSAEREAARHSAESAREAEHRVDVARDDADAAQRALAHAQTELTEARRLLTDARADADAIRITLNRIEQGFLHRRLLPLLWHVRLWLLPDGSARYRLYRRLRTAVGRLLVRHARPRAAIDPAEIATAVPDPAALAVVVMDVGGQHDAVEAVASLVAQSPRPEIVVVSSGGGNLDEQLAAVGLEVTVVQVSSLLMPGAARNVGLAATDAPYVAFLAGDCVARPRWVAGRLAAHAAGADIVASAVVNHRPRNPFAAAAHTLLFSPRLPGTPPRHRLHYGASFSRSLVARHGVFRADLRTGEDTELRERVTGHARLVYRGDVQAAHRNPTRLLALLADQFHRGRRTVAARDALYGGSARWLVARTALTRCRARCGSPCAPPR
ncbi:MAG: glycosyltransferase [Vicinamibacterales bacterium]